METQQHSENSAKLTFCRIIFSCCSSFCTANKLCWVLCRACFSEAASVSSSPADPERGRLQAGAESGPSVITRTSCLCRAVTLEGRGQRSGVMRFKNVKRWTLGSLGPWDARSRQARPDWCQRPRGSRGSRASLTSSRPPARPGWARGKPCPCRSPTDPFHPPAAVPDAASAPAQAEPAGGRRGARLTVKHGEGFHLNSRAA